jgi:CRP-like cAMP-binding protein
MPGAPFGVVAAADDARYDTTAEALVTSHIYRIGQDRLAHARRDGRLTLQLLDALAAHRLLVSQKIDEVVFKSVPARLASVLLNLAPATDAAQPASMPRHSHRQLAEMINAYRETVTKVINQFRAARLLEIDGSTITLLNRGRLEELAQGW